MATKIPLKIESGDLQQLSSTDTIPVQNLATGTANSTVFLRGDGTWASPPAGGVTTWSNKTSNYTASAGDKIIANTSGGTFTVTLPAAPSIGDMVEITDGADWSAINLTVVRNGSTIEGGTDDVLLNIKGVTVTFIYSGTTWQVVATLGPTGPQGPTGLTGPTGATGSVLANALTSGTGLQYDAGSTYTGEFAKTMSLTQNQRVRTINFIIDGAGPIATGVKGEILVDFSGTITNWTLISNAVGYLQVTVSKASYANYPTFTASGGSSPNLNSAQKSTLAVDWTGFSTVSSGDILRFTVPTTPSTAITRATLSLSILLS